MVIELLVVMPHVLLTFILYVPASVVVLELILNELFGEVLPAISSLNQVYDGL